MQPENTQNESADISTGNTVPEENVLPTPVDSVDETMPVIQQLTLAIGGLLIVFSLSYLPSSIFGQKETVIQKPAEEESVVAGEVPFDGVRVIAESAYVWDIKNQKAFYNKNAGKQMPLASLTKLMTALVVYDHLDSDTSISITPEAIRQEGDSLMREGEVFNMEDLAHLTLLTSSNDGAYALAQAAGSVLSNGPEKPVVHFVRAMNQKAEEIGLLQSYFRNPTGLDVNEEASGSYGTARDVAFLMEYLILYTPEILDETNKVEMAIYDQTGTLFNAVNTNQAVSSIPGFIASKTGYTDLAGGNLVVAFDAGLNRPVIVSVLGSTREGRFADALTLIKATQTLMINTPQP